MSDDIVLIHPPTTLDFRTRKINFGLISSTVNTTPIFECFPVGFLSLAAHLKAASRHVRILNLANRMLLDRDLDPARFIENLSANLFGVSLHWLTHADGAMETCRLLKFFHPQVPLIVGGISASHFHEELARFPYIDFILRGDSVEKPFIQFLRSIASKQTFASVPNLTWRDRERIVVNPASYPPETINARYDYGVLVDSLTESGDVDGNFLTASNPKISFGSIIPFVRGCVGRCATCGGSNYAFGRARLGRRSIAAVVNDISIARSIQSSTITLYGDIRQSKWNTYLTMVARRKLGYHLRYELQWPANRSFLRALASASPDFEVMMSPETHDEALRRKFGRFYGNDALERTIANVIQLGGRVGLFFMVGLPFQNHLSVRKTLEYIQRLFDRHGSGGRFDANIGALAPFIDPGSPAFRQPSRFGYQLRYRTLAEHATAGRASDWRDMFNYESSCLSRSELAEATWEATDTLWKVRYAHGLINKNDFSLKHASILRGWEYDRQHPTSDHKPVCRKKASQG